VRGTFERSDTGMEGPLALLDNLLAMIETRSFSALWYWVLLALAWSGASHWVIGVPYDMVARARRHGGAALHDLEAIARIHVARKLAFAQAMGIWVVALFAAGLTTLMLLGFVYNIELAQAVFLLIAPLSLVSLLGVWTARRIASQEAEADALCRILAGHRLRVQLLGTLVILVTALWGTWRNLTYAVLGG